MKPIKSTVYLPVNTDEPSLIVQEYQREITVDLVKDVEGYFFTPEQLNEYTANVIKKALETAAENAESYIFDEDGETCSEVRKQSITNTFEEIYRVFSVD